MTRDLKRRIGAAIALAVASALMVGCGEAKAACGDAFAEKIDSKSAQHLLPDAAVPKYATDPPTSGAHRAGGISAGVSDVALDKPTQVAILESGDVLVQYRDATGDLLEDIRSLAGENVVVAPNKNLDEPIVATAWLNKMECSRFDATLIGQFIDKHVDNHDGH
ncbi:MAG: DUF3105 domain-containing protein [Acidimicrobiales bacterium]|nr:DUF3105 domain-containing protein [Acidimicrobiales bacterium]